MAEYCKYYKEQKWVSYDYGVTYNPVQEFRKGELYEYDSDDCGGKYFTIVANSASNIVFTQYQDCSGSLQYSKNGGEWTTFESSGVPLSTGDILEMKGDLSNASSVCHPSGSFSASTGNFSLEGNIMSILYGDTFNDKDTIPTYRKFCFYGLFEHCTGLTSINEAILPATTLAIACYQRMFWNCTSLSSIPIDLLPATSLAEYCYMEMFDGCTSLTTVPDLPATNLSDMRWCYCDMFKGCTSLTSAPSLPATNLSGAEYCYNGMFSGCTALTTAPSLPATTLANSCYGSMFDGCTSLTSAPSLPATNLSGTEGCYYSMFKGCTSVSSVPSLPATALGVSCYEGMFYGCTSITSIPSGLLPVRTLSQGCYKNMFLNCTSLTTVPIDLLPATSMAASAYTGMFGGCTSLTTAPDLPATTLAVKCYEGMFEDCTSLTRAPELPAATLYDDCYRYMFIRCSNLSYIKCLSRSTPIASFRDWVYGVSNTGIFVKAPDKTWPSGDSGIPSGWTIVDSGTEDEYEIEYLTFIAQDNGTFTFNGTSGGDIVNDTIYYSLDNGSTWSTLASGATSPTINSGNKIMWKGELQSYGGIGTFSSTGRYSVEGNAMSLLYGDNFIGQTTIGDTALSRLFQGNTGLTSVENMVLPATSLQRACYYGMFSGCTALTTAMEILPFTGTVRQSAYAYMFYGCASLTRAPELPGKLSSSNSYKDAYNRMFYGCTSLNYIKCLATSVPSDDYGYPRCTSEWVYGVAATGTFVKNASTTWPTGTKWVNGSIPDGWTVIDAT